MYIERGKTNRGFEYTKFQDSYNNKIKTQLSSKVTPHIWIFCKNENSIDDSPHLNIEQAKVLRDVLNGFIKEYEGKETILDWNRKFHKEWIVIMWIVSIDTAYYPYIRSFKTYKKAKCYYDISKLDEDDDCIFLAEVQDYKKGERHKLFD